MMRIPVVMRRCMVAVVSFAFLTFHAPTLISAPVSFNTDPSDPLFANLNSLSAVLNNTSVNGAMPTQQYGMQPSQGYPTGQAMYAQMPTGYPSGQGMYGTSSIAYPTAGYTAAQQPVYGQASAYSAPRTTTPQYTTPQYVATQQGMPAGTTATGAPRVNPTNLIGPALGAMTIETADQLFTDVKTGTAQLSSDEDFVATLESLEKAFNQCDFSRATGATSGLTKSMLVQHAVAAVRMVIDNLNTTWTSVQRTLTKALTANTVTATQNSSNQNRWMAAAYMLAAAANNPTFQSGLREKTLSADTKYFWEAHVKVFSVQPVCLRKQNASGLFVEDTTEKNLINKLFQAETLLCKAHTLTIGDAEEQAFASGVRQLADIISKPDFANVQSSIGLKEFAFWIFQNGVMSWLNNLSVSNKRHDELWIMGAECLNLMYSTVVGPQLQQPPDLSTQGVNRQHALASDHLYCSFGKGSFYMALQATQYMPFTTTMNTLASTFTKHIMAVGKQAGLIAKNLDELRMIMMCSEAAEYLLQETTAPSCADLIGYFYEKGFKFNYGTINHNALSIPIACLPGVLLERMHQKTSTSLTVKGLSQSRSSLTGDYTTAQVYQSLDQALVIFNAATGDPAVSNKTLPIKATLSEAKKDIEEYMHGKKVLGMQMGGRSDLKSFRPRTPVITIKTENLPTANTSIPASAYAQQPAAYSSQSTGYAAQPTMYAPQATQYPGQPVASMQYASQPASYAAQQQATGFRPTVVLPQQTTSYAATTPVQRPVQQMQIYAPAQQVYMQPQRVY